MNHKTFWAVLAFACLCGRPAFAQNRWEISVDGGAAIPARANPQGNTYGESTGLNVDAQVTYRVWNGLGISLLAGYNRNIFDNENAGVGSDLITDYRLLVGPSYRLPLGEKWAVTARVLAGYQRADLDFSQQEYRPFTVQAGLGVQYALGAHLFVQFTGDYSFANSDATGVVYVNNQIYGQSTYEDQWNFFFTNVGIGLRF